MITVDEIAAIIRNDLRFADGVFLNEKDVAASILRLIATDPDRFVVAPVAAQGAPEDHLTILRIEPVGGTSPAFLEDRAAFEPWIRKRFNPYSPENVLGRHMRSPR